MSKDTLVDRLRGKYAVGPGDPPEFGYRTFTNLPPIFGEAAFEIEHLRAALAQAEARVKVLVEEVEAWRREMGHLPKEFCTKTGRCPVCNARATTDAAGALTRGAKPWYCGGSKCDGKGDEACWGCLGIEHK